MLNSVLDNDVVEKLCRWDSLDVLANCFETESTSMGYLGSLRYVVGKRLEKLGLQDAAKRLESFIDLASELLPSQEELDLAAALQELSEARGLDLDAGESILFAAGILRRLCRVLTGDKRAICSCPEMANDVGEVAYLKGRLVSLEQVLGVLVEHLGQDEVRRRVCSDRAADKTACICFSCGSPSLGVGSAIEALLSYQADLTNKSAGFSTSGFKLLS